MTYFYEVDPAVLKKEKHAARELRASRWWREQLDKGICYYCAQKVPAPELTMDHVVPLARGGRSTKSNIVPCCKNCNNNKKDHLLIDMLLS